MKKQGIFLVSAALLVGAQSVIASTAEEAATACTDAAELIQQNDLPGALEEAEWCVESLKQLKQEATLLVFPDTVDSFAGGELNNQSAMGMTILERGYEHDGRTVTVALTTGAAGGGLAALAQLGMGLGGSAGKKMRIQKRTVIDMSQAGEAQYMVQLKSGGMLNISSTELSAEELLLFIKSFPIVELDDSLAQ